MREAPNKGYVFINYNYIIVIVIIIMEAEKIELLSDKIETIIKQIVEHIEETHPIDWEAISKEVFHGNLSRCKDARVQPLYDELKALEEQQLTVSMKLVQVSQENIVKMRATDKEMGLIT